MDKKIEIQTSQQTMEREGTTAIRQPAPKRIPVFGVG